MELIKKDKEIILIGKEIIKKTKSNESFSKEHFLNLISEKYFEKYKENINDNIEPIQQIPEYQNKFYGELYKLYSWIEKVNFSPGASIYNYVLENQLENFKNTNEPDLKNFFSRFTHHMTKGTNIKLNSDWIPILLKTDNELEYKNLPYNIFFIDACIPISEDIKIFGILVENLDFETVGDPNLLKEGNEFGPEFTKKNLRIDFYIEKRSEILEQTISKLLTEIKDITKPLLSEYELKTQSEKDFENELVKIAFNFVFNICDMLNNKQVDVTEKILTDRAKRRKERIGELPGSEIIIKLEPKSELKKYIKKFNSDSVKLSHKFLVRGHFRSLINKDKYKKLYDQLEENTLSEKYIVNNKIIKTWIKPHFKGQGIVIKKNLNLK